MPVRAKAATLVRKAARRLLPLRVRDRLRAIQRKYGIHAVPVGSVDFGTLRRLSPISPLFGIDRDLVSVERYYIEQFLQTHADDIRGRVLEIGDSRYTLKFGGPQVVQSDVLSYVPGNPEATIVADLTSASNIPDDRFDCVIITQTLQMIYDVRASIRTLYRILSPGGVVLATSHGISRIARREGVDDWGEYWHFTCQSKKRLFEQHFPPGGVTVKSYGNVLSAISNMHGLAAAELLPKELDYNDPDYEVIVTVCARKPLL